MSRMNMSLLKFDTMKGSTLYLKARRNFYPYFQILISRFGEIRSKRSAHDERFSASMCYVKISALTAVFLVWT